MTRTTSSNDNDFEIEKDPFYSKCNMEHLKKSIQELHDGKGKVHELIEDDD